MKSKSIKYLMILICISLLAVFAAPAYAEMPRMFPRDVTTTSGATEATTAESTNTTAVTTTGTATATSTMRTTVTSANSSTMIDPNGSGADKTPVLIGVIIAIVVIALIVIVIFMLTPKRDGGAGMRSSGSSGSNASRK